MIQNDHMMTAESGEFSSSDDTRETEDAIQSNCVTGKHENRQIHVLMKQGIWTRDAVPPCLLTARLFE